MPKTRLPATELYKKIQELKGFSQKQELARFFGVKPGMIPTWIKRDNLVPEGTLLETARRHNLNEMWLLYGEGAPTSFVAKRPGLELQLTENDLALIERTRASEAARSLAEEMLRLQEHQMDLIAKVAAEFKP